jgi:hypothetical protein
MFGRLQDWRRIATHCDRRAHTFFPFIYIYVTRSFLFYLNLRVLCLAKNFSPHAAH